MSKDIEMELLKLLEEIQNIFKKKTSLKNNNVEYISALVYLKYYDEQIFDAIYNERKNYYVANIIDENLKNLRLELLDKDLFINVKFSEINFFRDIGEDNILSIIIEELYKIENKFKISLSDSKELMANSYEEFIDSYYKKCEFIKDEETIYTPKCITNLLADLIVKNNSTIFNPFSNCGNFILSVSKYIPKNIIGFENEQNLYNICKTNLFLHDINNYSLYNSEDIYYKDDKYDIILANPPFSQKNWQDKIPKKNMQFINNFHLIPTAFGDYAYTLSMFSDLKQDGKMAVILPHGVLFRQNEEEVRKRLVDSNYIDAIISLPENLFYDNRMAVIILILAKNKKEEDILFIDASKNYDSERNNNVLANEQQKEIVDTYKKREEREYFSKKVDRESVKENNYNLTIKRYIKSDIAEKVKIKKMSVLEELKNLEKESVILEDNINDVLESLGLSQLFIKNKKEISKCRGSIDYNVIGQNIKLERKKKGYTIEELSSLAGVSYDFLRRVEFSKCSVSLLTLTKICDALQIKIDDLFKEN